MIIEYHVHICIWDHADFLGRSASLDDLRAAMTVAGVSGAVLMPTDRRDNAALAAEIDAASFGSLWFVPWVGPTREDADWLQANAARLAAIKIHPSLSRVRVTDPAFGPVLDVAEAIDKPMLVHCGRWQEMASYRFAMDVAAARPRIRFILAHAGGDTPPLATGAADLVLERGLENVWFDLSGLREHWVVARNIGRLGAGRYLFGSDLSLAHPAMYVAQVRALGLTSSDEDQVLGGNARVVFGPPTRRA
jgi:predicted TIM-barrel fold metal-dependent hydrolase